MTPKRQQGVPHVVAGPEDAQSVTRLERIPLDRSGPDGSRVDEVWLQRLVQRNPELLPIGEIEPAFVPIVPVCMELPTSKGFIDNFFMTPTGNLVFAECKLWRNPEARRQVVAQVMDYAESLTSWGYANLEDAVRRAQLPRGGQPRERLYDLVGEGQELDEAEFVDAVARNLRLGRGLFFIIGDGIREETETLTAHLQAHAGIHFALALVELALFSLPNNGGLLVQPRTIARTVHIERGIVRFDDARISIVPARTEAPASARKTLSEEEFYERIAKRDSRLPERLRAFLERLTPLGVEPEFRKSLILRWRAPDGTSLNVGYIQTDGQAWTGVVGWRLARELGILDIMHDYVRELAAATNGEVKRVPRNEDEHYLILEGHTPKIEDLLEHEDAWTRAIEHLGQAVTERLEARND